MITIVENAAMAIEGQKGTVRGVEVQDEVAQAGTRNVDEGAVVAGVKTHSHNSI